ncbi:uncharacterized protein C24B11.05-like [Vitis riparia]|uniref:uncharacterized protein C24B11.05-like n=1 Tax=Vitis riparia TaxID=96939 RepID=UPI00155B0C46|nr:uncharacterized protein C24B11.05-like [Vitis riparia]
MDHEDCYQYDQTSKYDCLLFDIDDTLYPLSSGLSAQITKNIQEYMLQKLGMEEDKISEMCALLYKHYGTTMAGLRAIGYNFDYDDFHSFVHGRLPYELLKPDPVLRSLLLSLPIRKVVFTNADKGHAARVLNRLGLEDCFEGVICFETLNPINKSSVSEAEHGSELGSSGTGSAGICDINHLLSVGSVLPRTPIICKPFTDAFEEASKIAEIDPRKTLFFDDNFRNLQGGKSVGLHTVLVGSSHKTKGADYALESIHNIREALPELWEANEKSENVMHAGEIAIETPVRA